MRTAILTLAFNGNYGGIIQAYALREVLQRMGHDAVVIQSPNDHLLTARWRIPLAIIKRILLRFFFGRKDIVVFREWRFASTVKRVEQHTRAFADRHIRMRMVRSLKEICEGDYDAFVVGSDQVWRPLCFRSRYSDIADAYLSFAEGWKICRVAYAPSFATDEWEYTPEETERCGRLLRQFDAVSVRERSGIGMCREHYGIDARHVLDPTMLLSSDDYRSLFAAAGTPKSPGTLMTYVLDEDDDKSKLIEGIARQRGLTPFATNNNKSVYDHSTEESVLPPIESWLRGFDDAEFVVTDSFHACVFSIIFRKQFVVYGNRRRGMSRFVSLLSMFGLEERMVFSAAEAENLPDIDYDRVSGILEDRKAESAAFLRNALKKEL